MIKWLFHIDIFKLLTSDIPLSLNDISENKVLLCILNFDGKEFHIPLTSTAQIEEKKEKKFSGFPFKFRLQASSIEELAKTLFQRYFIIKIIKLHESQLQESYENFNDNEVITLLGSSMINILSLAKNVTAQYNFEIKKTNKNGIIENNGNISLFITMKQISSTEIKLVELNVFGVNEGDYRVQCQLHSVKLDAKSKIVSSKLNKISWKEEILPKVKLHASFKFLTNQLLNVKLLQVDENGIESLSAFFNLSLAIISKNVSDTFTDIFFTEECKETSKIIMTGIWRSIGLPNLSKYLNQQSLNNSFISNEISKEVKLLCMNIKNSPTKLYKNQIIEITPHLLSSSSALVLNSLIDVTKEEKNVDFLEDKLNKNNNISNNNNNNNSMICNIENETSEEKNLTNIDMSDKNYKINIKSSDIFLQFETKEENEILKYQGEKEEDNEEKLKQETKIIHSNLALDLICETSENSYNDDNEDVKIKEINKTIDNNNNFDDKLEIREKELQEKIAYMDKRIDILKTSIGNSKCTSLEKQNFIQKQKTIIYLRVLYFKRVERILLEILDIFLNRLDHCNKIYKKAKDYFEISKKPFEAYVKILSCIDRRVREKINNDGSLRLRD